MTNLYVVEKIGYNDGLPYGVFSSYNLDEAGDYMTAAATENPRVAWRLIHIEKEITVSGVSNTR